MATRLQHWDKIEAAAKALLDTMERAARDQAWRDPDVEEWCEVHDALSRRPQLSVSQRDRLSGRFGESG